MEQEINGGSSVGRTADSKSASPGFESSSPCFELPHDYGTEILRCEVGSTLHGTGLPGGEDHDEMGIFVATKERTVGFRQDDQYIRRSKPEGVRSEPGDTDLVVYNLRKWCRLALNGNPSVLLPLWAPENKVIISTGIGQELRALRGAFVSKVAGRAFLGYMVQQRKRMTGERGRGGRIRVQPDGSPDWKYAMHMLRLGYQGREFLSEGKLSLPVPEEHAEYLRAVRRGEARMEDVLDHSKRMEEEIEKLIDSGPLPTGPDVLQVERWMIRAHERIWSW